MAEETTETPLVLPDGVLAVGREIARGSNGFVHEATLHGEPVCAKVRVLLHATHLARC
jgi:hypothetical protein